MSCVLLSPNIQTAMRAGQRKGDKCSSSNEKGKKGRPRILARISHPGGTLNTMSKHGMS